MNADDDVDMLIFPWLSSLPGTGGCFSAQAIIEWERPGGVGGEQV